MCQSICSNHDVGVNLSLDKRDLLEFNGNVPNRNGNRSILIATRTSFLYDAIC